VADMPSGPSLDSTPTIRNLTLCPKEGVFIRGHCINEDDAESVLRIANYSKFVTEFRHSDLMKRST
jgi:hypothetical protein